MEAAKACFDKKAEDIVILDLRDISYMTDYFVICSASSMPQVRAVVRSVEERFCDYNLPVNRREGDDDSKWVLIDLGDVVVHVFLESEREYYDLERLWRGARKVEFASEHL